MSDNMNVGPKIQQDLTDQTKINQANTKPTTGTDQEGVSINAQGTSASSSVERTKINQDTIDGFLTDIQDLGGKISDLKTQIRGSGVDDRGNPSLSTPFPTSTSVGRIPEDIESNSFLDSSFLLNFRLSQLEMQSVNRETALEFGLMEAELMLLWKELQQEVAKETKAGYKEQAKMAMYEIIGAAVSIAVSAASLAFTAVSFGAGYRAPGKSMMKANPDAGAPGAPPQTMQPTTRPDRMASAGQYLNTANMGGVAALNGIGSGAGQMIAAIGKMEGNQNLAQIEKLKILLQATAEQIKKAQDSLEKGANDALDQNDKARQMLKQVSEEFARLFNSVTPH